MLEQIFLQENIYTKDRITANDMHKRLKEFADNTTRTALDSNLDNDSSM
ncbi:1686_t:CDS:2, partial [Scutellospora calospora]